MSHPHHLAIAAVRRLDEIASAFRAPRGRTVQRGTVEQHIEEGKLAFRWIPSATRVSVFECCGLSPPAPGMLPWSALPPGPASSAATTVAPVVVGFGCGKLSMETGTQALDADGKPRRRSRKRPPATMGPMVC